MIRYSLLVILHVAGIALLSVTAYWLGVRGLWFSTAACGLLLVVLGVRLYRLNLILVYGGACSA